MSAPHNDTPAQTASDAAATPTLAAETPTVVATSSTVENVSVSVSNPVPMETDPSATETGESAAKKKRGQVPGEDTSTYLGPKRSKVRGNIRGADNYKGKIKGPWGPGTRNAEDAAKRTATVSDDKNGADTVEDGDEKEARIPKRKVALLMGYCGTGYQGMQVNPNAKTIEGDLFKAMVQAGAVSKDNADDIKKVQIFEAVCHTRGALTYTKIDVANTSGDVFPLQISMMRSARTDKGVHAAGNVVSLKMIVDIEGVIEKINSYLPEQIRLFGYVRTLNSFSAKTLCDSRVYEYLLPTYVFLPRPPLPEKPSDAESSAPRETVVREDVPEGSMAWDENVHISTPEEMAEKRSYRIDPATLDKVRQGFSHYVGTKNFHNFTIGKNFKEKSSQRFIMKFDVSDPKIIQGTEWLSLKVHGQSFMLHQIRKMVGLIVMIVRTDTPLKLIPETFKANKINIPKAPSLGLLLERPMFDTYNRKVEGKNPPLVFSPYDEEMQAFKEKHIYEGIIKEELEHNRFDEYLQIMDGHADRYNFAYLNKDGIIPEEALIKRGDTLVAESDAESDESS
ncbi:tRNA pseudouridine synthase 1 [Mortierella claussenii]|nr:tRNA pseudouridine synthase 1 [Mortierella claussenii]